jgi:hypothetical protein
MSADLALTTICQRYKERRLNNVPPSRTETLSMSPYLTTNFTKFDLDMRRKAQVLKYNELNIQANNLTKNQKFSQIMKQNNNKVITNTCLAKTNFVLNDEGNKIVGLKNGSSGNIRLIHTNPSASGVPPDPRVPYLYDDEKVPLYNYLNPISTRSNSVQNPPDNTIPFIL